MKSLGFIVDEVRNNSKNYLIFRELNKISKEYDCYLFVDKVTQLPMENDFAILQQIEAMKHPGVLVSTSMLTSQILVNNLTADKKFFYMQEIEWPHANYLGANQLHRIFQNDDVNLAARSHNHYVLLDKLFKTPACIIKNWRAEDIMRNLT